MNIYEKMNVIKKELHSKTMKKSGKNDFNKQSYFQLQDFLPTILDLCYIHKLNTYATFPEGKAVLVITNIENPEEQLMPESPFGSANLKGCHEVQNIGAVETYQRRYLYMAVFDIIENDVLDSGIVQDFDSDITRVKKCQDIAELTDLWKTLYNKYKSDKAGLQVLTREKDIMKESLSLGGSDGA